jgi:hypothetical protein
MNGICSRIALVLLLPGCYNNSVPFEERSRQQASSSGQQMLMASSTTMRCVFEVKHKHTLAQHLVAVLSSCHSLLVLLVTQQQPSLHKTVLQLQ